jgi:small neutral amino acid transporter SnatA (MarC family)
MDMIFFVMLVKTIAWFFAFRSGTRSDLNGMLLRASGITVFLTLADKVSVASNLEFPAILLTLCLYALMSFTLLPLAWKLKNSTVSLVLNLMGMLGAFAGVNFTMDALRTFLPFMNR